MQLDSVYRQKLGGVALAASIFGREHLSIDVLLCSHSPREVRAFSSSLDRLATLLGNELTDSTHSLFK
ncbi:hypothetical protein [Chamaesiphon polymorphus]|uniref:Uncharacterized protein n=1 Tax=Chamaesiphon polymorphus CCALA 037 TaxID=2107692 RepID=A0A2T1GCB0_9CYAN|nr:hypothetical protein [Chamaesiphon polymorphus]PSB55023.1 hypothetical protein C7B77_16350 [Chamaesiphon polymorphus CCALA 037]